MDVLDTWFGCRSASAMHSAAPAPCATRTSARQPTLAPLAAPGRAPRLPTVSARPRSQTASLASVWSAPAPTTVPALPPSATLPATPVWCVGVARQALLCCHLYGVFKQCGDISLRRTWIKAAMELILSPTGPVRCLRLHCSPSPQLMLGAVCAAGVPGQLSVRHL
jgi:hypothetical protein